MTRNVMCRKYKEELEGLAVPPYPGEKGKAIFENVSKKAWQAWLKHQTMLINEKHLNLMDAGTQSYLHEQLEKFLDNDDVDKADGYVPPSPPQP